MPVTEEEMKRNIFDELRLLGHDEDFYALMPRFPTLEKPGSIGKFEVLWKRVESGESRR